MEKIPRREFGGKLSSIDPSLLLKSEVKDPVADFFLALAYIYNDVKGLVFFFIEFQNNFLPPNPGQVSCHAGEVGGLRLQMDKLFHSTIHELFEFLRRNEKITLDQRFLDILKELNPKQTKSWQKLLDKALVSPSQKQTFRHTLMRTRGDVGFHYYNLGKNLRKGFLQKFQNIPRSPETGNDFAYYSIGSRMSDTRFYYADAALAGYFDEHSATAEFSSKKEFNSELVEVLRSVNAAILPLLVQYLETSKRGDV